MNTERKTMSANPELYLVTLEFTNELLGGGQMTTQFAVNTQRRSIHGRAHGDFPGGTESPLNFGADFDGEYKMTGFGGVTRVGSAEGKAIVAVQPPKIGAYLSDFSMDFAVDDNWNGHGSFTIDGNTYKCEVKSGN